MQRLRFQRVARLQSLDRDQIIVEPAPAAGCQPGGAGRIEQCARVRTCGDDVIPQDARLTGRKHSGLSRGSGPLLEMLQSQPCSPGQRSRRAPGHEPALLRLVRVFQTHGMRKPPARGEQRDALFEQ